MNFTYQWRHIPTNANGTRTIKCLSRAKFLELLDNWNRMGGVLWKYVSCTK